MLFHLFINTIIPSAFWLGISEIDNELSKRPNAVQLSYSTHLSFTDVSLAHTRLTRKSLRYVQQHKKKHTAWRAFFVAGDK